jgi:RNA polymerase sigma-70 factor (ECF subfamily)
MTAPAEDDAALMLRVQEGDSGAFERLVERYRQPILNFVQRTLPDAGEAEDIAQQAFVQAWKAAGRYRATARFSTWLYTIARNLCLNELRRRGRHPAESMEAPVETGEGAVTRDYEDTRVPGVLDQVLLGELTARIEEALADLPENQRSAILLFREQELAYEDIAGILGVSVSATKSLIHRGRETLKSRLKPYLRTGVWADRGEEQGQGGGEPATFPGHRF